MKKSRFITDDLDGNGTVDVTTSTATVLNANGSRTTTMSQTNANGSLRNQVVTTVSDDQQSSTANIDSNGDGITDRSVVLATLSNGDVVETTSTFNASNQLINKTVKTTGANGLSQTTQQDLDGNATYETTTTDVTVLNADGSRTQTLTTTNANGSLRRKDIITTSDDGETVSVTRDLNGDGVTDRTRTTIKQANGDVVETCRICPRPGLDQQSDRNHGRQQLLLEGSARPER